jgi:hypothetical protein
MNCDCGAKELADGAPAVTRDSAMTYTRHTAERCEPGSGLWNVLRDTRMPGCGEPLPLTRWQRLRDRIAVRLDALAARIEALAERIRWGDR